MEPVNSFWPGMEKVTYKSRIIVTLQSVSFHPRLKELYHNSQPPTIRATAAGRRFMMCSIADLIPEGHKNAVTREKLRELTGLTDREMRDCLHYARRETVIVNAQDGKGYFKPNMEDPEDRALFDKYFSQEDSRLKSQGWAMKAARALKNKYS